MLGYVTSVMVSLQETAGNYRDMLTSNFFRRFRYPLHVMLSLVALGSGLGCARVIITIGLFGDRCMNLPYVI
jgi:hypothetical protein